MSLTLALGAAVVLLVLFLAALAYANGEHNRAEDLEARYSKTVERLKARQTDLEERIQTQYANHVHELLVTSQQHADEVATLKATCADHLKSLELALSDKPKSKAGTVTLAVDLDMSKADEKLASFKDKVDEVAAAMPAGRTRDARGRFAPKAVQS